MNNDFRSAHNTASTPKSNVNLNSLGCHISNGVWITLTYNMLLFLFNNNTRCDSALTSSWPTRYRDAHFHPPMTFTQLSLVCTVINAICMRDCSQNLNQMSNLQSDGCRGCGHLYLLQRSLRGVCSFSFMAFFYGVLPYFAALGLLPPNKDISLI